MLVLSRSLGEEIDLTLTQDLPKGTRITFTMCDFRTNRYGEVNRARIGIDAPKSVLIDRHEISLLKNSNAST